MIVALFAWLLSFFLSNINLSLGAAACSNTTPTSARASETELWDARNQATANLIEMIENRPVNKKKVTPTSPSVSSEQKVTINTEVSLISVLNVDSSRETILSVVQFTLNWYNKDASWDEGHFSGVEKIEMPIDSMWTPPMMLMNSLDHSNIVLQADHLLVLSNGSVLALFIVTVETRCMLNHAYFPYDTQVCYLIPFSLSNFAEVSLTADIINPSMMYMLSQRSNWSVMRARAVNLSYYGNNFPSFEIKIQRHTTFYTMCLVLPMVVTYYINTLVFLVPQQSGEKISFLVTILVSNSVFISFFSDFMPKGLESVPAVMKLLIGVIVQSLVILLATLFVQRRFYSQQVKGYSLPHTKVAAIIVKAADQSTSLGKETGENYVVKDYMGKEQVTGIKDGSACIGSQDWNFTVQQLELGFFVLAFLSTTLFLCIIFFLQ